MNIIIEFCPCDQGQRAAEPSNKYQFEVVDQDKKPVL